MQRKTALRQINTGFAVTAVVLLSNFACAHDMRSDLPGLAMNSGLSVISSMVVCLVFVVVTSVRVVREAHQPAWGCLAMLIWFVGMYAVLDLIWSALPRVG